MTSIGEQRHQENLFTGCLLGGAVGDALGAPVEFMSREQILQNFGLDGIRGFAPAYGGYGRITDDTQMSLFTAEGLLRAAVRGADRGICHRQSMVASAYERWLYTQGLGTAVNSGDDRIQSGWLIGHQQLHQRRTPGSTCINALQAMRHPGEVADNDSKGCGGVMRAAPAGMYCVDDDSGVTAFQTGIDIAAITHGHPTGYLAAGALAQIVAHLLQGHSLAAALFHTREVLIQHKHHQETLQALRHAEQLAHSESDPVSAIAQLGKGWVAEEALAIAVYCALTADSFEDGVCLAVNHDGDSDSTGAIAGNLLGAIHGRRCIPGHWLEALELRDVIEEVAMDLLMCRLWEAGELNDRNSNRLREKYPGY